MCKKIYLKLCYFFEDYALKTDLTRPTKYGFDQQGVS